jgi:acetoin:2,6-dichlorophenolindophenol oxidoreductase subunit beta
MDTETVLGSVRKTGRVIIVEENPRPSGWGAEVSSLIAEKALCDLKAPITRVTSPLSPVPYSPVLEKAWMPDEKRIYTTARGLVRE